MAKILIIDDEAAIRAALKDILEHEQHTVEEAADGAAGVAAAKKGAFDLVLCDIKMPKMDGLEVLEKLQAFNDELPVVMIDRPDLLERRELHSPAEVLDWLHAGTERGV